MFFTDMSSDTENLVVFLHRIDVWIPLCLIELHFWMQWRTEAMSVEVTSVLQGTPKLKVLTAVL